MYPVPLKAIALACFCQLASSFLLLAQAAPPLATTPPDNVAAAPTATTTTIIASARDAGVPSLEELGLAPAAPAADTADSTDAAPDPTQEQAPAQTTPPTSKNPTAPAPGNVPSLQDLGFTSSQTQSNTQLQAQLDKRTHMLKIHQKLGVITLAPLLATVFVSGGAKAKVSHASGSTTIIEPSSANLDLHAALGSLTASMYVATAYFAIRAPKVPGTPTRGAIRIHKALAFIHGPGMVLTPILGGMALSQENKGEKVHGIATAHSYVAWTTVLAYSAAIVSVSWPIHLKF